DRAVRDGSARWRLDIRARRRQPVPVALGGRARRRPEPLRDRSGGSRADQGIPRPRTRGRAPARPRAVSVGSNIWLTRARGLHAANPVVEAHGDIPMDLWRRRRAGERTPLRDDFLPRLRAGGVRFEFMTVGGDMPVTMDGERRPELRALELIDDVLTEVDGSAELQVVRTQGDLDEVLAAG